MADYKTPQWLLPNEKNLAYPAAGDGITGSGLSEDRHSLYSMDFDGTQYIDCGNDTSLQFSGSFSISAWVKIDDSGTNAIVSKDSNASFGLGYHIDFRSGNAVHAWAYNANDKITFTGLSTGVWYNVVFVFESTGGSNGNQSLYVNAATPTTGSTTNFAASTVKNLRIGSSEIISGMEMNGLIDEVAIWNKALSASEVSALLTASAPANLMALSAKPIAYYPLGEQAQMGYSNWNFPNGSLQSHVIDFSTQDYIQYPHININGAFTISTWVKTTDTNTYGNLFSSSNQFGGDPSGGSSITNNWKLIRWNRSARFNASNSSNSIIFDVNTGTSGTRPNLYDGNWHHVLAIWDGTTNSNGVKIFFDGVLRGLGTASSTAINNDNSIPIRAGSSNATFDFIGEQSNQQIWNTALTYGSASADGDVAGGDVANIYNNGSPQSTYTTTPTAWWKLNAANSSYVYPWSLELNGSPDVGGTGDHAKVVSNALQVQDINTTITGGKVDFLTREITGAYSGINVTGEFIIATASAGQSGATLYYKIDGGSWVQFQQQLDTSGTTTYAISGASGLTSTTSFQVKIEFETGNAGSASVTLNNISIGDLYTEDFTNQDGAGWDIDTYTPPPVDWTFIDTETPAPNYTSALDFVSADSDYIEVANNSSLQLTDNLTLSCWINANNVSGTNSIIDKFYDGADRSYLLRISGTRVKLYLGNTDGSSAPEYQSSSTLSNSVWYHIVTTFSSIDNEVKIYINGSLDSTHSKTDLISSNNEELRIGTGYNLANYFDGSISNCSIYSSALSAAQVQTLYNSGTPETAISFSPVSWWKLDNTTTGIQDSGSASNNGTNNGATQIATNVLISNNGESDTLPTSALTPSDLQFESPYSNYSLDFDGIGNDIDCGTASYLSAKTIFTISTWFNTDTVAGTDKFLINIGSSSSELWGVQLYNGLLVAYGGSTSKNLQYNGLISINTWYNLVLVYDGGQSAADRYKVYLNGVLLTPTTTVGTIDSVTPTFTNNLTIGKIAYSAAEYWNGKIDETAIWNSALTQAQVSQVYNNGYPADLTSLSPVSWWRLGEDSYFVSNVVTIPNQITGGQTGTGSGTQTAILVGEAPGSYANGLGSSLDVEDRIGDAPESTANSVSINMIPSNRISYPAGYTPTQVNNAFSMAFDGVDDYITAGNPTELQITGNLSLSAWVKTSTTSTGFVISKDDGSNRNYALVVVMDGGTLRARFFIVKSNTLVNVTSTTINVGDNNFHNIVGVNDGTDLKIYVDGNLEATNAGAGGTIDNDTVNLDIGRRSDNAQFFDGNIDEVAIFDYALSARQIKQDIYEGTTPTKTADLNNISNLTAPVAWYRMGD